MSFIKDSIIFIIIILSTYFIIHAHEIYIDYKELKQKISIMKNKQQTQENVIVITDKNQIKNKQLENEVNNKIKLVKNIKVRVLSQEQFIIKSNNVFKNFGNGN